MLIFPYLALPPRLAAKRLFPAAALASREQVAAVNQNSRFLSAEGPYQHVTGAVMVPSIFPHLTRR